MVTPDAVAILALLSANPTNVNALIAEVAVRLGYQMSDEFSEYIKAQLSDMETLDIVEFR